MSDLLKNFVKRYEGNPILTKDDVPYQVSYSHNAAACKFNDDYVLMFRADRPGDIQCLGLATSKNGYDFTVFPEPVMTPEGEEGCHVYDSRITKIDDDYYLTYATESEREGIRAGIAVTRDFKTFERISLSEPDNRNAALFPEKINGLYVRLDRPFAQYFSRKNAYSLWISYSPDLVFWGKSKLVLAAEDCQWGARKVGAGAVPIKTEQGWLEIYHCVDDTVPYKNYCLGCMLLDLDDPSKIIGMAQGRILEPEMSYEIKESESGGKQGRKVIFCCGAILEDNGELKIYYGGADQCMCLAIAKIEDLIALCLK